MVDCLTGVTQGCGLGSTMFSIATFVIVKAALAGNPGCDEVHNIAFADDGTSLGPKNQVIKFAGELKNRLRDEAGLEFRKWAELTRWTLRRWTRSANSRPMRDWIARA